MSDIKSVSTLAEVAQWYPVMHAKWTTPSYVHERIMLAAETMMTRLYRWERDHSESPSDTAGLVHALSSGQVAACMFVPGLARVDPVIPVVESHLGRDIETWDADPAHDEDDALRVLMELLEATAPAGGILWQRDPERAASDRLWATVVGRALAYATEEQA